jgi:iron complex outermembrane recepter protein
MNLALSRFATLMGSASLLTLATAVHAQQVAQAQMAQAAPEAVPEQVLVTGSLIHGTAAVGVPVTNLGVQDFTETGNVFIGDLFRTVPEANVSPGPSAINSGGHQERETRVNIRGLDATGPRSLLMVDGVRFPPQADGLCAIDPSIIPQLALDRVDILADGASATYGSDAIAGVINVVLKRGFDGATTLLHVQTPTDGGGGQEYQASQLWGRTWDGGDITLTYEYIDEEPVKHDHSNYTLNYSPWGIDNEIPIGSSLPGVVSTGKPSVNNGAGLSGVGTVCSNCYSVPLGTGANFNAALNNGIGPTAPGSAATATWAQLLTHAGVSNGIDPLPTGWEEAEQQRNSFVATVDQRLFPGVSVFFTGFLTNRRVKELTPLDYLGASNDIKTFAVPTTNPYYPTGAPNGLQVSYDLGTEYPPNETAYELSGRYQFGLNLDLPFNWTGQIYDSRSYESDKFVAYGVNDTAVSIALGTTVNGISKPASVPYLNLFCDPRAFQCNSPVTLSYIGASRYNQAIWQEEEKGGRFDGPLFDLPGGQVKAAIGGTYESDNVLGIRYNNLSVTPLSTPPGEGLYGPVPADLNTSAASVDPEPYTVWAGFAQLDIPLFGDNFNFPLVRKFDLEASWRHDQYNSPNGALQGGTSNPKLAFTWLVDEMLGATIRGSWGTSFRFANAGEYSTVLSDSDIGFGFFGIAPLAITCGAGNVPTAGSFDAALVAAGFACGSAPGGISWGGGPHAQLREYVDAATGHPATREGGTALAPETAENYSVGFEIAPTLDFLRGLDLQATWYSVKISNVLSAGGGLANSTLADPTQTFRFIQPSNLGCPVSANANPTTCAPFEAMVLSALSDVGSTIPANQATNVYWLEDGSTFGSGFLHVEGIDWNASYNFDLGDLGAWNTGITGTYYLHRWNQTVTGGPILDGNCTNLSPIGGVAQNCVETAPKMIYRARLGWSDGPYNVAGFMNYSSHYFSPIGGAPPNVNFQCTSMGGSVGGGTFPCAISDFTNHEPSFITFDLSFGYNTGDIPANDYIKNITLQLTVQNLLDRHSPFDYINTTAGGRQISAYDITRPNAGRVIGLTLVKNW